jgi:hypothetical protein
MSRAPSSVRRPVHSPLASPASRAPARCHGARRSSRRESFGRQLRAALGAAAVGLLLSSACGDDSSAGAALDADAGPSCERGTRGCACILGSGCRGELLCIAGLCSSRPEEAPDEMNLPPRPRPTPPDPGDPDPDAGPPPPADAGEPDASVPETPAADAGNDAG